MLISDLDKVSVRAVHALNRAGILTVEELVTKTEDDLMSLRDFGIKFLYQIESALSLLGMTLNKNPVTEEPIDEGSSVESTQEEGVACYEVTYDLYVHVTGSIFLDKKPITQKDKENMIFSGEGIRRIEEITTNPINSYEGHLTIKKYWF